MVLKIAAIVAEYNPFHLGHKYQIDSLRQMGFTHIIAVMSGNFVQRGDVAILDKFTRTSLALENGVDLCLQIPTCYCLAPAQKYAFGAISVLKNLGVDFTLCFGSESGDISLLKSAKEALSDSRVQQEISDNIKSGKPYARICSLAVQKYFGEQVAAVLSNPNDTLGIEYLWALKECGLDVPVIALKRKGVEHNDKKTQDNFACASLVREMVLKGEDVSEFVPSQTDFALKNEPIYSQNQGEKAFLWALREKSIESFESLTDECEGLSSRLFESVKTSTTAQQLFMSAKTKRYTLARIRRLYFNCALGINEYQCAPYIRALGCTDAGAQIMSLSSKVAALPIVTSYANAKAVGEDATNYFEKEAFYTDFYSMFAKETLPKGKEFCAGFVKI